MILQHSPKIYTSLSLSVSFSQNKRFYPGSHSFSINQITNGVRTLLGSSPRSITHFNPEITKQYLKFWRSAVNPELAEQIHAYYLNENKESPFKLHASSRINKTTIAILNYLKQINPKNDLIQDTVRDMLLSKVYSSYSQNISDLIKILKENQSDNHHKVHLIEAIIRECNQNPFDKQEIELQTLLQEMLNNFYLTTKIESRDDYEFRQIYNNTQEPKTDADKIIKAYFLMKKPTRYFTEQDYETELKRKKLLQDILINHSDHLDVKKTLEILRKEGLLVNTDAGFAQHLPYLEGQGPKLNKEVYKYKKIINKENVKITEDMKNYINACIKNADYKISVGINDTSDAVILDNIQLHPCLVINHPTDKEKLIILGYQTSANLPGNLVLDNRQQDFPIAMTADKSKKPQFEQEMVTFDDPFTKKPLKAQYFAFLENIVIVEKTAFLENTLATYYMTKGLNSDGESILNKLQKYFFSNFDYVEMHYNEKPIVFDLKYLINILQYHIHRDLYEFIQKKEKALLHLKSLKPEKRKEKLLQLENTKKNYLLKEEKLAIEKMINYNYPEIKNIMKMIKLLEEKKQIHAAATKEKINPANTAAAEIKETVTTTTTTTTSIIQNSQKRIGTNVKTTTTQKQITYYNEND